MSTPHTHILPNTHLFLRLPSDLLKLIEIKPNTIIDVGKLGSFPSNLLLGRPYYFTFEILDKVNNEAYSRLRVVTPSELNAEVVTEDATPSESRGDPGTPVGEAYDLVGEDGTVIMKNNRLTIDDASRQALSQQEIEELKKSAGGKEIIQKILAGHAALDEKTVFAKAKYTLRKTKKYLKRFTVLPMDLGNLIDYVIVKEAPRIMELREEGLGLMMAWGHAHYSGTDGMEEKTAEQAVGGGRWLVVDDTGGLVVAALAERMDLLFKHERQQDNAAQGNGVTATLNGANGISHHQGDEPDAEKREQRTDDNQEVSDTPVKPTSHLDFPIPARTNTVTLLHPAVQPNVSLLKYFGYDTNQPDPLNPLHTHLKPLSWLQLLHPEDDVTYREPEREPDNVLRNWKSGKRGTYWKKRRRWERCKAIVDETRQGGFDGLVIASNMDPASVLPHTVPLVRGGGHIVIYCPAPEPLVNVMDLYSKERRTAYITHLSKGETPDPVDFPVDPRLLLAPTMQTSRVREWQVLPGRTHPMMTSRGGPEGYIFTARRVVPLEGGVQAKGNFGGRKRKAAEAAGMEGDQVAVVAGAEEG
ncbi:tRNA (adenine(58)-N(1))-methyltransferase non-catalytic subunit trm6 [Saxophila tyrrhenica]|uniref:tRNA (adenine(58)-N(1))-methyltransferase non-catalytic subunit TRM6 n=1 Tax=Saxophila tyrrhenica TaxID=1690608 RepID=A0AAV9P4A5_9PEZI|nr:tRNA (adenine(58)-N(1))-methyltransferase non-catalytic subunit trm6 [Saxophila tyrrhenica]